MQKLLIILLSLGPSLHSAYELDIPEVTESIAAFERIILPPEGSSRDDIEAVYGPPQRQGDPSKPYSKRYSRYDSYTLLPHPALGFKTVLLIEYDKDITKSSFLNHMCVLNGRFAEPNGPDDELLEEFREEKISVLHNLVEIYQSYRKKLNNAKW
jgi:hypothetical protein